jgi:hypothetical protein
LTTRVRRAKTRRTAGMSPLTICKLLLLEHGGLGRVQVLQRGMLVRPTLRHSHHGRGYRIARGAGYAHGHLRRHPTRHALLGWVMGHAGGHGMAGWHAGMLLHGVGVPKGTGSHACHHVCFVGVDDPPMWISTSRLSQYTMCISNGASTRRLRVRSRAVRHARPPMSLAWVGRHTQDARARTRERQPKNSIDRSSELRYSVNGAAGSVVIGSRL